MTWTTCRLYLKTKLTYELDAGNLTDLEKDRNFELQYRKFRFRDIDSKQSFTEKKRTSSSVSFHDR